MRQEAEYQTRISSKNQP